VRELEHCVTRAVVLAKGSVIRSEHLSIATPRQAESAKIATLDTMEKEHVAKALIAARGRKVDAAALLGVSRPRLNRLIEKYDLD
jgi:DNA-binding NtrC family response regulator